MSLVSLISVIHVYYTFYEDSIALLSEKYVEKLFGVNKDRMSMDQMAVLLVSNINESKGHSEYISLSVAQKNLIEQICRANFLALCSQCKKKVISE